MRHEKESIPAADDIPPASPLYAELVRWVRRDLMRSQPAEEVYGESPAGPVPVETEVDLADIAEPGRQGKLARLRSAIRRRNRTVPADEAKENVWRIVKPALLGGAILVGTALMVRHIREKHPEADITDPPEKQR